MTRAERVNYNGGWGVWLACGHSHPAGSAKEADGMIRSGVPIRCYECVEPA